MAESGAAASGAAASGAPVDKGNDIAILGGGNLGRALARGWIETGLRLPEQIIITRRNPDALKDLADEGFTVTADNAAAVRRAGTVILSVQPQQLKGLIGDIRDCDSTAALPEGYNLCAGLKLAIVNAALDTVEARRCVSKFVPVRVAVDAAKDNACPYESVGFFRFLRICCEDEVRRVYEVI